MNATQKMAAISAFTSCLITSACFLLLFALKVIQVRPPSVVMDAYGGDKLDKACFQLNADPNVAKTLLDQGAAVNGMYKEGSPLRSAATFGNVDVVRLLLKRGANPHLRGYGGETVLMCVGNWHAAEVVDLLVKAGADVNARDDEGNTPLMVQTGQSRVMVVKALLKHGANVNAKNFAGKTALRIALDDPTKWTDIIDSLKQHGAK